MTELLVTMILAVCPPSINGDTNECMENITNCAVELKTLITPESINKCIKEYEETKENT